MAQNTIKESRPDPDPTVLTTQQLDKAIDGVRQVIEARLDGYDRAIKLLQEDWNRLPILRKEEIGHLKDLHDEKFTSISAQIDILLEGVKNSFLERDKRTEQLSLADKTAIAAALQAQKEAAGSTTEMIIAAITKMEGNFIKSIDQTQVILQAGLKNADEKINDVKSRMDKGEGRTSISDPATTEALKSLTAAIGGLNGAAKETSGHNKGVEAVWAYIVGAGGFLVAIIAVAVAIIKN